MTSHPDVDARLWAHVDAVLADAHVPPDERDDIAEELHAHLVEAWSALVDQGRSAEKAATDAIRDFGDPSSLGRELTRSYQSRAWASTIGVLLPAKAAVERPPGIVMLLSGTLLAVAGLIAVASVAVALNETPLHAILVVLLAVLSVGGVILTRAGLMRHQFWALPLTVVGLIAMAGEGVFTWLRSGGHTVSISAIIGALGLLAVVHNWHAIDRWTDKKRGFHRPLVLGVAALVLGPWLLAPVGLSVPDPTQATPDDLHLVASMRCGPGEWDDTQRQRVTIAVEWNWDRTSLLPGGLIYFRESYSDGIYLASLGDDWARVDNEQPTDVGSGEQAGWQGSGSPADRALPSEWQRSQIGYGIPAIEPQAHHRYRASWTYISSSPGLNSAWPSARIRYHHVDHWGIEARVSCGGEAEARPSS